MNVTVQVQLQCDGYGSRSTCNDITTTTAVLTPDGLLTPEQPKGWHLYEGNRYSAGAWEVYCPACNDLRLEKPRGR